MYTALTSKRSRCGPFDDVERSTLLKSVCVNRANVACGISDWNNVIFVFGKGTAPPPDKRKNQDPNITHF